MTTQTTSTERAGPVVRFMPRVESIESTWAVEWPDGTRSAMPDESTARRCAASGALEAACTRLLSAYRATRAQIAGTDDIEEQARAALALARPQ